MTGNDVLEILNVLNAANIPVWIDGGWGIDALIGKQTREHDDLVSRRRHYPADLEQRRGDARTRRVERPDDVANAQGRDQQLAARRKFSIHFAHENQGTVNYTGDPPDRCQTLSPRIVWRG